MFWMFFVVMEGQVFWGCDLPKNGHVFFWVVMMVMMVLSMLIWLLIHGCWFVTYEWDLY